VITRLRAVLLACIAAPIAASAQAATAASGNAEHGLEVYARCGACHALEYNRTGPKHCGVVGRKAGTVPGFDYSPAMAHSKLVWDRATLDRFLTNPPKVVPGTTMTYAGIPDARDRADVIAYLDAAGRSAACRPSAQTITK
jgi:cytochrome c